MNKRKDIFSPFNMKKEPQPFHFQNPWLMVREWYSTDLGQALLVKEKESLAQLLDQIFGYNLLQLGCIDISSNSKSFASDSRTSYQFILESVANTNQANACTQLLSNFEQLPIQTHSIDAVILPHTLEFEQNPHQILREVERILVAEGKAIFLGFNPFS
ncbi:MAG: class I SAM-dependent methyltransferase, partial [Gammaproteobacteria bacterium]|nr:class I SAM-dependent methyltransferase [Gammaproteobacteria bacterium]